MAHHHSPPSPLRDFLLDGTLLETFPSHTSSQPLHLAQKWPILSQTFPALLSRRNAQNLQQANIFTVNVERYLGLQHAAEGALGAGAGPLGLSAPAAPLSDMIHSSAPASRISWLAALADMLQQRQEERAAVMCTGSMATGSKADLVGGTGAGGPKAASQVRYSSGQGEAQGEGLVLHMERWCSQHGDVCPTVHKSRLLHWQDGSTVAGCRFFDEMLVQQKHGFSGGKAASAGSPSSSAARPLPLSCRLSQAHTLFSYLPRSRTAAAARAGVVSAEIERDGEAVPSTSGRCLCWPLDTTCGFNRGHLFQDHALGPCRESLSKAGGSRKQQKQRLQEHTHYHCSRRSNQSPDQQTVHVTLMMAQQRHKQKACDPSSGQITALPAIHSLSGVALAGHGPYECPEASLPLHQQDGEKGRGGKGVARIRLRYLPPVAVEQGYSAAAQAAVQQQVCLPELLDLQDMLLLPAELSTEGSTEDAAEGSAEGSAEDSAEVPAQDTARRAGGAAEEQEEEEAGVLPIVAAVRETEAQLLLPRAATTTTDAATSFHRPLLEISTAASHPFQPPAEAQRAAQGSSAGSPQHRKRDKQQARKQLAAVRQAAMLGALGPGTALPASPLPLPSPLPSAPAAAHLHPPTAAAVTSLAVAGPGVSTAAAGVRAGAMAASERSSRRSSCLRVTASRGGSSSESSSESAGSESESSSSKESGSSGSEGESTSTASKSSFTSSSMLSKHSRGSSSTATHAVSTSIVERGVGRRMVLAVGSAGQWATAVGLQAREIEQQEGTAGSASASGARSIPASPAAAHAKHPSSSSSSSSNKTAAGGAVTPSAGAAVGVGAAGGVGGSVEEGASSSSPASILRQRLRDKHRSTALQGASNRQLQQAPSSPLAAGQLPSGSQSQQSEGLSWSDGSTPRFSCFDNAGGAAAAKESFGNGFGGFSDRKGGSSISISGASSSISINGASSSNSSNSGEAGNAGNAGTAGSLFITVRRQEKQGQGSYSSGREAEGGGPDYCYSSEGGSPIALPVHRKKEESGGAKPSFAANSGSRSSGNASSSSTTRGNRGGIRMISDASAEGDGAAFSTGDSEGSISTSSASLAGRSSAAGSGSGAAAGAGAGGEPKMGVVRKRYYQSYQIPPAQGEPASPLPTSSTTTSATAGAAVSVGAVVSTSTVGSSIASNNKATAQRRASNLVPVTAAAGGAAGGAAAGKAVASAPAQASPLLPSFGMGNSTSSLPAAMLASTSPDKGAARSFLGTGGSAGTGGYPSPSLSSISSVPSLLFPGMLLPPAQTNACSPVSSVLGSGPLLPEQAAFIESVFFSSSASSPALTPTAAPSALPFATIQGMLGADSSDSIGGWRQGQQQEGRLLELHRVQEEKGNKASGTQKTGSSADLMKGVAAHGSSALQKHASQSAVGSVASSAAPASLPTLALPAPAAAASAASRSSAPALSFAATVVGKKTGLEKAASRSNIGGKQGAGSASSAVGSAPGSAAASPSLKGKPGHAAAAAIPAAAAASKPASLTGYAAASASPDRATAALKPASLAAGPVNSVPSKQEYSTGKQQGKTVVTAASLPPTRAAGTAAATAAVLGTSSTGGATPSRGDKKSNSNSSSSRSSSLSTPSQPSPPSSSSSGAVSVSAQRKAAASSSSSSPESKMDSKMDSKSTSKGSGKEGMLAALQHALLEAAADLSPSGRATAVTLTEPSILSCTPELDDSLLSCGSFLSADSFAADSFSLSRMSNMSSEVLVPKPVLLLSPPGAASSAAAAGTGAAGGGKTAEVGSAALAAARSALGVSSLLSPPLKSLSSAGLEYQYQCLHSSNMSSSSSSFAGTFVPTAQLLAGTAGGKGGFAASGAGSACGSAAAGGGGGSASAGGFPGSRIPLIAQTSYFSAGQQQQEQHHQHQLQLLRQRLLAATGST